MTGLYVGSFGNVLTLNGVPLSFEEDGPEPGEITTRSPARTVYVTTDGRNGFDGSAITVGGRKSAVKDPSDIIDFSFNWSAVLLEVGDEISVDGYSFRFLQSDGPTITAIGIVDGVTGPHPSVAVPQSIVIALISGGEDGDNYDLVSRIETVAGRVFENTLQIRVREQ